MTLGRCKECKYSTPACTEAEQEGFLICLNEKWVRGYHRGQPLADADGVRVESDEGWAFQVGPEFGCVHFEPK